MKVFTTFFQVLFSSASDPDFYIGLLITKFRRSLGFFLTLILILAILDIAIFRFREVPKIISGIELASLQMADSLPKDFTLTYDGGVAKVKGVALPYIVKSPAIARDAGFGDNFMVFQNQKSEDPKAFAKITNTELVLEGSPSLPLKQSTHKLKDLFGNQTFNLDKTAIQYARAQFISDLPNLANILSLLAIPFWFVGLFLTTTITLALLSLFTNTFAWAMGIHLPFTKTFQLGLHAIGVATFLDVVKYLLLPASDVSLVIPGYIGIMGLVFWRLRFHIVEKIHRT